MTSQQEFMRMSGFIGKGVQLVLFCCLPAHGLQETPATTSRAMTVHKTGTQCENCHSCASPTSEIPCLRPCLRISPEPLARQLDSKTGPKVVVLGELQDVYLPVPFDHRGHADMAQMAGGCTVCHHHTPQGTEHPTCKSCHEAGVQRGDIRKPGLKGAYHRQCLSCHREWSGEESCSVCHQPKTGKGPTINVPTPDDIIGRMHPPITAPDEELYKTEGAGGDKSHVLFRHKEHADRYGLRCAECHREDNCNRCHRNGGPHVQQVRTFEQHHEPCFQCHKEDRCERCHVEPDGAPTPPFDHLSTGWELSRFHRDRSCRDCHVDVPFVALKRDCNSCHGDWSPANFDHALTGQALDERHAPLDCDACHLERRFDRPPSCKDCHEDDGIDFPARRPGAKLGVTGG